MKPIYNQVPKKPGTCTVYIRFIEKGDKAAFKAQCARRDIPMLPACIEFMRRSRELVPMLNVKDGRRVKLNPDLEYGSIHIRPTPNEVRSLFKTVCAEHGLDMIVAMVEFFRQANKILPLLRVRKRAVAKHAA